MSNMTKAEIEAAMDQITNCVVSVKLRRLPPDEIEEMTRPRKRRVKKRYSTLDFNDDNEYFEKACSHEVWDAKPKRSYNYSRKRKKTDKEEKNKPFKKKLASYLGFSNFDEKPFRKSNLYLNELGMFSIKEDIDLPDPMCLAGIKKEPLSDELEKNTVMWKIRIKSASELGSSIIFVDTPNGSVAGSKLTNCQPVLSDLIANEAEPKLTESSDLSTKYNIHTISNLYKEFFTKDNQTIIRNVAEVLKNLSENIKKKTDKLSEINSSRSTDAEKLMLRHQAHSEFDRVKDYNQIILKEQFGPIDRIFNNENFKILFQLFFLGILKMFILSVSIKKGTLFKKIVSLLSQSLSCCNYQNERILSLLKSKDFRADCIALVHFIEKYSETKFFDMMFISEADKVKILNSKNSGDLVDVTESPFRPSFLSTKAKIPSIVKYSKGMNIIPVGSNLLLQRPSGNSTSRSKVEFKKAEANKKVSKFGSASVRSIKPLKIAPACQNSSRTSTIKKSFPESGSNSVISGPLCAPNYVATRGISSAIPLSCPPPYSVSCSTGSTSFSAINALANNTLTNSSSNNKPIGSLMNSGCNIQPSSTLLLCNSSIHPMSSLTNSSSSIQHSTTFTNCSSNSQPLSTLTISSSSNQPRFQSTVPMSTTIPTLSYPFVMSSNLPPVVSTNYIPNVVLSSTHTSNRPHSVIVAPGSSAFSVSNSVVPPPTYSVANAAVAAQRMVQPSPPAPQLLPPVIPPLQPQAVNHALTETVASDYAARNCNGMSVCLTDAGSQNESSLRTYGSAKDVNKRVQLPPLYGQSSMTSRLYPSVCTDNATLANSVAPAKASHHFIAPGHCETGLQSATIAGSSTNGGFSPYRTISPAGNCENIQPNSPHSLQHPNTADSSPRLKDHSYSTCPTTSPNDGLTLRTLLIDNGRAPLVNQNGPIEAAFQFAEKANYSSDIPSVMSPDSIIGDTLAVSNHLPMTNCVAHTFPC